MLEPTQPVRIAGGERYSISNTNFCFNPCFIGLASATASAAVATS